MADEGQRTSEPAKPPAEPARAEEPAPSAPMLPGGAPTMLPADADEPVASTPPPEPAQQAPPVSGWVQPAAPPTRPPRSRLSGIAGAILLVLGIIGALLALVIAGVGGLMGGLERGDIPGLPDIPGLANAVGGLVVVIGVVVLVYSLLYFFAGIGVLRGQGWGRAMGIVVAIISGLFWLAALASPSAQANTQSGVVFSAILLGAHAYVLFALTFRWRDA